MASTVGAERERPGFERRLPRLRPPLDERPRPTFYRHAPAPFDRASPLRPMASTDGFDRWRRTRTTGIRAAPAPTSVPARRTPSARPSTGTPRPGRPEVPGFDRWLRPMAPNAPERASSGARPASVPARRTPPPDPRPPPPAPFDPGPLPDSGTVSTEATPGGFDRRPVRDSIDTRSRQRSSFSGHRRRHPAPPARCPRPKFQPGNGLKPLGAIGFRPIPASFCSQ